MPCNRRSGPLLAFQLREQTKPVDHLEPRTAPTRDFAAVERLSRLLAEVTEDARQLANAPSSQDQLRERIKLAAALASRLAASLRVSRRDELQAKLANDIAARAIERAGRR